MSLLLMLFPDVLMLSCRDNFLWVWHSPLGSRRMSEIPNKETFQDSPTYRMSEKRIEDL
jgi:hypothetical protein